MADIIVTAVGLKEKGPSNKYWLIALVFTLSRGIDIGTDGKVYLVNSRKYCNWIEIENTCENAFLEDL